MRIKSASGKSKATLSLVLCFWGIQYAYSYTGLPQGERPAFRWMKQVLDKSLIQLGGQDGWGGKQKLSISQTSLTQVLELKSSLAISWFSDCRLTSGPNNGSHQNYHAGPQPHTGVTPPALAEHGLCLLSELRWCWAASSHAAGWYVGITEFHRTNSGTRLFVTNISLAISTRCECQNIRISSGK